MNVTKCANGHFYDADKFRQCPHCGAGASAAPATPAQTQKSHNGFWNRKKQEKPDPVMIEMPDGNVSKTVGIFGNRGKTPTPEKKAPVTPPPANNGGRVFCGMCGTPYDPAKGGCPKCAQKKTAEASPKQKSQPEAEVKTGTESPAGSTLQDAIKKATAASDGKTVGFFGASSAAVENEPVVGWLVCVGGKHFGEAFGIVSGRNSVGRGESNKIVLAKDDTVSRNKHIWLTYEPKKREFFVQPGEGSGLAYLNGENILTSVGIKSMDTLELGSGKYLLIPLCNENFSWEDYMNEE